MTELEKKECYKSYLGDLLYEWGTTEKAMSFEEFCKEADELGDWSLI